jgi:stearoyl-CoA desaturase (delta-9 desaturase)
MGWLFVENDQTISSCIQYAKDIYRQPFYLRLEKKLLWLWLYAAHAMAFYCAGFLFGWLLPGSSVLVGIQFGLSLLVWGIMVRTVAVWHITWSVNSIAHLWGYRSYQGHGNSRNNFLVGIISNGEGWHNNHHADQRAAAHGHRWWELDVSYLTIRALQSTGLVWDVIQRRVE